MSGTLTPAWLPPRATSTVPAVASPAEPGGRDHHQQPLRQGAEPGRGGLARSAAAPSATRAAAVNMLVFWAILPSGLMTALTPLVTGTDDGPAVLDGPYPGHGELLVGHLAAVEGGVVARYGDHLGAVPYWSRTAQSKAAS